ncbi:hypothetical protein DFAR_1240010 [Desulfarculales bacterium]
MGLFCNQAYRHCHLQAGPDRPEAIDAATVEEVLAYTRRGSFQVVDITGGAPKLNPHLERLLEGASVLTPSVHSASQLDGPSQDRNTEA